MYERAINISNIFINDIFINIYFNIFCIKLKYILKGNPLLEVISIFSSMKPKEVFLVTLHGMLVHRAG